MDKDDLDENELEDPAFNEFVDDIIENHMFYHIADCIVEQDKDERLYSQEEVEKLLCL
ncbi:MAG: hypothetical protein QM613_04125 [Micrococcaceae bacterium]